MLVANTLTSNCLITKKIETYVNKMFKMSDEYLLENNKTAVEKLNRNFINTTFENFRKKKEAQSA